MLILTWKYGFSIKPYSSCKSRIYLSQYYKGFWGYIRKKKRAKSEKREGEERTSVILGEKGLPP
jgi:hypothetical protein